ncbi:Detected protein of confused Function [Hibiscus syriacus]|uniref:Detected protein of confused Function n=1 Tax=Hibiscus syriacus TaxID=106335 RepID=A0A6A2ZYN8_HIBSY|nr:Detected protein of confused Function [Hibiscus syriacus]
MQTESTPRSYSSSTTTYFRSKDSAKKRRRGKTVVVKKEEKGRDGGDKTKERRRRGLPGWRPAVVTAVTADEEEIGENIYHKRIGAAPGARLGGARLSSPIVCELVQTQAATIFCARRLLKPSASLVQPNARILPEQLNFLNPTVFYDDSQSGAEIASTRNAAALLPSKPNLPPKVGSNWCKKNKYVMIVLKGSVPMSFGGTEQPAAYGELISIGGLNPDVNKKLSAAISAILETKLQVPPSRFFLKFYDTKASYLYLLNCHDDGISSSICLFSLHFPVRLGATNPIICTVFACFTPALDNLNRSFLLRTVSIALVSFLVSATYAVSLARDDT